MLKYIQNHVQAVDSIPNAVVQNNQNISPGNQVKLHRNVYVQQIEYRTHPGTIFMCLDDSQHYCF